MSYAEVVGVLEILKAQMIKEAFDETGDSGEADPDEVPVSFRSLKPETLADVLRPVTSVALKAAESFDAPIDITNPVPTWNKVVVIE